MCSKYPYACLRYIYCRTAMWGAQDYCNHSLRSMNLAQSSCELRSFLRLNYPPAWLRQNSCKHSLRQRIEGGGGGGGGEKISYQNLSYIGRMERRFHGIMA